MSGALKLKSALWWKGASGSSNACWCCRNNCSSGLCAPMMRAPKPRVSPSCPSMVRSRPRCWPHRWRSRRNTSRCWKRRWPRPRPLPANSAPVPCRCSSKSSCWRSRSAMWKTRAGSCSCAASACWPTTTAWSCPMRRACRRWANSWRRRRKAQRWPKPGCTPCRKTCRDWTKPDARSSKLSITKTRRRPTSRRGWTRCAPCRKRSAPMANCSPGWHATAWTSSPACGAVSMSSRAGKTRWRAPCASVWAHWKSRAWSWYAPLPWRRHRPSWPFSVRQRRLCRLRLPCCRAFRTCCGWAMRD